MSKLKIGVLMGGMSGEHEVSLVSAKSVIDALDKDKYDVIPITISKDGRWSNDIISVDPNNQNLDVVFPVLHGTYGEDGKIQGLLELANIPYVGAGVIGSAVGMDKIISKQLFKDIGLNIVDYVSFLKSEWQQSREVVIKNVEDKLNYPMFIKPVNLGSSVGISKAHNKEELIKGINEASEFDLKIIVEQGLENMKEIECAVLGNDNPKASVPGQVIASNEFYDYDAKYVDGKSEIIIPAKLPKIVIEKIKKMAIDAFKVLNLSGMARVDFMVTDNDKIYINEANTIPGFTSISMYPKMWEASGLPYSKLLDELIKLALERYKEKNQLKTSFTPKKDWYKNG